MSIIASRLRIIASRLRIGQHRRMVTIMLILLVLAIAIGAAQSAGRPTPPVERLPQPVADSVEHLPQPPVDELSPSELALADPVEALLRYGTPDDAARLGEQGVDLGGLGYRPRPDA